VADERRWLHAANRLASGAKYLCANDKHRTWIVKRAAARARAMNLFRRRPTNGYCNLRFGE
jgi:hypothetical protein